jgi:hypothetical protein
MNGGINWTFIVARETRATVGYVPKAGRSGVTIASGVDLGQIDAKTLRRWGLADALVSQLAPYTKLTETAAEQFLAANPLVISGADVDLIDAAARADHIEKLAEDYDGDTGGEPAFAELPSEAQTVIASVAWQYGDVRRRCPNFWRAATRQDWHGLYDELMHFGDAYPTRRSLEAAYLSPVLRGSRPRVADA